MNVGFSGMEKKLRGTLVADNRDTSGNEGVLCASYL